MGGGNRTKRFYVQGEQEGADYAALGDTHKKAMGSRRTTVPGNPKEVFKGGGCNPFKSFARDS